MNDTDVLRLLYGRNTNHSHSHSHSHSHRKMLRAKEESKRLFTVKRAQKKGHASRLASRKIMAFHRLHIGPTQGVKISDAALEILAFLKVERLRGNLKLTALAAMAKHEGSLPVLTSSKPKSVVPSVSRKRAFYESWEWATIRMEVLKANGARCECCGAGANDSTVGGDPVRIQVDHIKPISKFWELRLEISNLQVLCAECNKGKGAWDQTDWRRAPGRAR